jgi:hypothetical protein
MIKEEELREYVKSSPNSLQYLLDDIKKYIDKKDFDSAAESIQQLHSNIIGLIICEQFLSKK